MGLRLIDSPDALLNCRSEREYRAKITSFSRATRIRYATVHVSWLDAIASGNTSKKDQLLTCGMS